MQAGVEQSVTVTLPILKLYPKIKITAKWEIKGDNGDNQVCFLMPIKIVDGVMQKKISFTSENNDFENDIMNVFQRL